MTAHNNSLVHWRLQNMRLSAVILPDSYRDNFCILAQHHSHGLSPLRQVVEVAFNTAKFTNYAKVFAPHFNAIDIVTIIYQPIKTD